MPPESPKEESADNAEEERDDEDGRREKEKSVSKEIMIDQWKVVYHEISQIENFEFYIEQDA